MKQLLVLFLWSFTLILGCTADRPTTGAGLQDGDRRIGQVYLVRGLTGMFSTGMDHLGKLLRQQGVAAAVIMHTQGADAADAIIANSAPGTPIIIIGHSLGADEAVSIARRLEESHRTVDLLITLDPIDAPRVPANVLHAVNYYRPGTLGIIPLFRGTPLHAEAGAPSVTNIDLNDDPRLLEPGTNHFTIDKNSLIQEEIVRQVLAICDKPRQSEPVLAKARLNPESGSLDSAASDRDSNSGPVHAPQ
jgi:hypothetical protein